jgi:hypothetical protein
MNILQSFRDAVLRTAVALVPSDAEVILRDIDQPELGNHPTLKVRLTVLAAKLAALIAVDTTTSGIILTKRATFAETASGVSHVATIPVPAGAIIHSIKVVPRVLWGATTSATLKVGDTADDDGYFIGVNLKATDLVVGEVLDSQHSTLWGGKEGAYLVAASGRRGPTSSNFGQSYVAGSNIVGTVTVVGPSSTAGRTDLVVEYSIPTTVAPVVS